MALYEFVDVTEQPSGDTLLPAEAVSIDGTYIEDLISGYRTLYTSGRESLEKEVELFDSTLSDGTMELREKFQARTITIGFKLEASSAEDFREKFNTLNKFLNVRDAECIFNDEPDKYFIGSPQMNAEVETGLNTVKGEFEIYCANPFKYDIEETVVETSSTTITDDEGSSASFTVLTTDNDGSYKTFPKFEVQFAEDIEADNDYGGQADCGYVLLAKNGTDYSLQFGDDAAKDTSSVKIFDKTFNKSSKQGFVDLTSLTLFNSGYLATGATASNTSGLKASTVGGGSKFHGPLAVYTLDQAATGAFSFSWKHVIALSKTVSTAIAQAGCFYAILFDESGSLAYAYGLNKTNKTNQNATLKCYVPNDGLSDVISVPVKYLSKNGFKKVITTKKTTVKGKKVVTKETTYVERNAQWSIKRYQSDGSWWVQFDDCDDNSVSYMDSVNVPAIKYVGFYFANYSTRKGFTDKRVLSAKFINGDYDTVNDFSDSDLLEIDTNDMSVILNGKNASNLGDIGNNWDNMYLDVGENTIIAQWSDWVPEGYEPTITMKYRKRWL